MRATTRSWSACSPERTTGARTITAWSCSFATRRIPSRSSPRAAEGGCGGGARAAHRRGQLDGGDRGEAARRKRLRLRPAFFPARSRQDRGGARAGPEESGQPSRQGQAPPAREAEGGRVSADVAVAAPPSGVRLAQLPPLALYVHIPWCVKKCPYCDFNSHQARGEVPEKAYVEALVSDLEQALPEVWGRR